MCKLPQTRVSTIIPNGYWKIIIKQVSPNNLQVGMFIFPQSALKQENYCSYSTSLAKVESISKLKFFPKGSKIVFTSILSDLGC